MRLKQLSIVVGTRCNFKCAHCTWKDQERGKDLSPYEVAALKAAIARHAPKGLLFTGGEPTLYVPLINEMITAHPAPKRLNVTVTTNGHFAGSEASARELLASFKTLHQVQLSYDKFHSEFLPFKNVGNLYRACKKMGIAFSSFFAIQSPLDLPSMAELSRVGKFTIGVQKVIPRGQARKNNVGFVYPYFDRQVLRRRCPNMGSVSYTRGKGFSVCCSDLVRRNLPIRAAHRTIEDHLKSGFYRLMEKNSFGELLRKFSIPETGIKPRHSEECELCRYIFSGMLRKVRG